MLKSYVTIALRSLRKHLGYTVLNVVGLSVGIASCLLIVLYVHDEVSYDRFHHSADRIVRVVAEGTYGVGVLRSAATSSLLGPALADAFPVVEQAVRLDPAAGVVKVGERRFHEELIFTDPSFFNVFTFPLRHGDAGRALMDRHGVILSEGAAMKFFGDPNPLGRTLSIRLGEEFSDFTVQGVAEPIPSASSIRFEVLLPFEKLAEFDPAAMNPNWGTLRSRTFLLLRDSHAFDDVQALLPSFVEANIPPQFAGNTKLELQRLTDIHLDPDVRFGLMTPSNPVYIYLLSGLAFFVLMLACINFTTLSLGQSVSRVREVGIRKVVGALRPQLMTQFWGEALVISLLALVFGLLLLEGLLPVFGDLLGKNLSAPVGPLWLLVLFVVLVVVSLVAGSYPAVFLSRFQPIKVLKGDVAGAGKHRLTRLLVVFQFVVSIFLVISTLVMSEQLDLLVEKNLGFDHEQVVRIRAEYGSTWEGRDLFHRLQARLATEPSVRSLAGSMYAFGNPEGMHNRFGLIADADTVPGYVLNVTPTFLETLGIELVQGRDFSEDRPSDLSGSVLVNQSLVDAFGWDDPIGRTLSSFQFSDATIIGVVQNFHYESLHRQVDPIALFVGDEPIWNVYARTGPGGVSASLAALEGAWKEVAPDLPFEFEFLDQAVDRLYRSERQWTWLIRAAAGVAIFIACLGLLGLAALAAARRRKEIGIRQVLGASAQQIAVRLTSQFVTLVLVAFVLAAPLAYVAMNRWLDDFAYRISLSPAVFLLAGFVALGVAVLSVGTQALRAALANPVDALRSE